MTSANQRSLHLNKHHTFTQEGVGYYSAVVCSSCGVGISNKHAPCFSLMEFTIAPDGLGGELKYWKPLGKAATMQVLKK